MPSFGRENSWGNPSSKEIAGLLSKAKTIAVVGLSKNPERASNGVSKYLQDQGYRIIPVNPGVDEVLGERAYADLRSIPETIDIIDVFRKPSEVAAIVEEAAALGVKAVWLQESVVSVRAFKKGEEAGLMMVMDRCMLKEHRRLVKT